MSKFEFVGGNETFNQIEMDGQETVYYGSVFFGLPISGEVDPYYLMDTNIFSYICKDKYPATLIKFISLTKDYGLELNPAFAIAEQFRSSPNPRGFVEYYQKHLKERFGIHLSDANRDSFCDLVEGKTNSFKSNIALIEDYLAIVKSIYNSPRNEKDSVTYFLSLIKEKNLPHLTFAIYAGLIFFFIKESIPRKNSIRDKVDKFLGIGKDYVAEMARLHNAASDISIFLNCQEIAAHSDVSKCTMASIVTCDEVVGHLLKNICIYSIENPVNGKYAFTVTIRNSSQWLERFQQYVPLIRENLNRTSIGSPEEAKRRRENLKNEWFLAMQKYLKF